MRSCGGKCEVFDELFITRNSWNINERMSEPKKQTIIHQIAVDTDDRPDSSASPQISRENSTSRNGGSFSGGSKRQSRRAKSKTSDATIESITLQETVPKSQSLPLKASFLRRKAKEYEGKDLNIRFNVRMLRVFLFVLKFDIAPQWRNSHNWIEHSFSRHNAVSKHRLLIRMRNR